MTGGKEKLPWRIAKPRDLIVENRLMPKDQPRRVLSRIVAGIHDLIGPPSFVEVIDAERLIDETSLILSRNRAPDRVFGNVTFDLGKWILPYDLRPMKSPLFTVNLV